MILTPVPRHLLPRALAAFATALDNASTARVFRRIAVLAKAVRATERLAALHHEQAMCVARRCGLALRSGPPSAGLSWDGHALRRETEAYVLLHEVAHDQLASPQRRTRADFGLGPGPETGARERAARQQTLFGAARDTEEAMASLLGILWEVELGHPALASFLDQNWLEGAAPARHFSDVLARLSAGGFITATGRPTRRLRRTRDVGD